MKQDYSLEIKAASVGVFAILLVGVQLFQLKSEEISELRQRTLEKKPQSLSLSSIDQLLPPDSKDIPEGPLGESIRHGELIVTKTGKYASQFVGNTLNCTSCHLDRGRKAFAAPWVGVWGVFPEYRSRTGRVNSLQDRVNDCFERSMNGRRLPDSSDEMLAILSYMQWLSSSIPTGVPFEGRGFVKIEKVREPDVVNGKRLYVAKCAMCHSEQGQGQQLADGGYLFPPLWGPNSFNIGAGMARLNTAAAFIKHNMPIGQEGTLTDEEAFDIAAYFTQQPRPDFKNKKLDWPKGGKPKDARY